MRGEGEKGMSYWRFFYHIVWGTKNREPLITPENEVLIIRSIRATSRSTSAYIHGFGAMPDHFHLVVSVPPRISISSFVHDIKGASSRLVRSTESPKAFLWQGEFGAVTFDETLLPKIVAYAENQKRHHANGTTRLKLEIMTNYRPSS
jgi:putative transposase